MREEGGQERSSNGHQRVITRYCPPVELCAHIVPILFLPGLRVWGATMVQRRLHTLLYYEVILLGARELTSTFV